MRHRSAVAVLLSAAAIGGLTRGVGCAGARSGHALAAEAVYVAPGNALSNGTRINPSPQPASRIDFTGSSRCCISAATARARRAISSRLVTRVRRSS